MKFKSDIEVQAGLKDSSGAAGTSGQVLSSTASGVSWVSQSGFVPYTGATGDVDLGIHQLKADSLAVSTSSLEPVDVGEIVWNAIDGTFDMGLIGGVTLQSGQEMHMYGKATEVISNGQAVMFAGVQGDHILIAKADAATINSNPEYFIGIATQNFAINQFGYVTVFGNVRGLDTTSYALGSVLYYDSTTSTDGLLTSTEPTAPNAKIEVAAVVRVHATQGILLVRPHVMPKLNDIQDIFAPNPFNNDVLFWNGFSSRYETETIPGILGYNPVPPSRTITINGVTQDLSVDRTFNINTGVTSFNTRTGAVTLTSTDVNTALGYTAANDANVVKLTGDQTIGGIKSFTLNNGAGDNFTFRINHFTSGGGITSAITPLEVINNNNPSTPFFKLDNSGSLTANSFVKIGGNSTQYLKADGSVSTAMNSRIEVNFVATAGQTTFTTPYEVGQIDVYYNGSKLYPNEFTATNGTTVVLAQAATLNAQISIVKYVAALSTSAIRNETTFTTTSGQTTFSVNYTVGQVDVFYNGSKLNVSEFTAINGTSVVLGFACAAGESVVFVSYVNQVSGASGTTNRVAKFTGAASLGDSSISDNGAVVSLTNSDSRLYGGDNVGRFIIGNPTVNTYLAIYGSSHATLPNFAQIIVNNLQAISMFASGNVFIGSSPVDAGYKLDINGTGRFNASLTVGVGGLAGRLSVRGTTNDSSAFAFEAANSSGNSLLLVRNDGNVGIGVSAPTSRLDIGNGTLTSPTLRGRTYTLSNVASQNPNLVNGTGFNSIPVRVGDIIDFPFGQTRTVTGVTDTQLTLNANWSVSFAGSNVEGRGGIVFEVNNAERMRITSGGNVGIGTQNPAYTLDVNGIIRSTGLGGFAIGNTGGIPRIQLNNGNTFTFLAPADGLAPILAASFNTSSDYRLKQDLQPINGLDLVSQIKVYDYEWKSDKTRAYGVLAHELQEVIPQAVNGEKDGENMQGVDYSKLVPILIKSIQELKAEIEILKNK